MFKIDEEEFGSLTKLELQNVITGELVSIIHDFGASINELILQGSDGNNHSIVRGTNEYRDIVGKPWFKGVKMIPYPNRVNHGLYDFKGESYQLPVIDAKGHHAIHGFMYNKEYEVVASEETAEYATVSLECKYDGKKTGYPFPFLCTLNYTLSEEGFEASTEIKNLSNHDMPVGDGWHPYFMLQKRVDKLELLIPASQMVEIDEAMIPTGNLIDYDRFRNSCLIGETHLDNTFVLDNSEEQAMIQLYDPAKDLRITVWQDCNTDKYPFVQVYTPDDRKSIAIEPMSCWPDAFNNGQGLVELKPGEVFSGSYGVTMRE